eukprot:TRINITY_DN33491_c0_g1_i1.p1 TRINITY_DN33491_c0_g1~~TRINITY_DN33491_c0_g1_i1.p1  ORF type:complete len:274 (+),score=71.81 TRINITY_DN33491_c0_g1_i1:81-902(+)
MPAEGRPAAGRTLEPMDVTDMDEESYTAYKVVKMLVANVFMMRFQDAMYFEDDRTAYLRHVCAAVNELMEDVDMRKMISSEHAHAAVATIMDKADEYLQKRVRRDVKSGWKGGQTPPTKSPSPTASQKARSHKSSSPAQVPTPINAAPSPASDPAPTKAAPVAGQTPPVPAAADVPATSAAPQLNTYPPGSLQRPSPAPHTGSYVTGQLQAGDALQLPGDVAVQPAALEKLQEMFVEPDGYSSISPTSSVDTDRQCVDAYTLLPDAVMSEADE